MFSMSMNYSRMNIFTHKPINSQFLLEKRDRVKRHSSDLKSRLWLFFSPFLILPKKKGRIKWEWISKIVILSHAFLLNREKDNKFEIKMFWYLSIFLCNLQIAYSFQKKGVISKTKRLWVLCELLIFFNLALF